MSKLTYKIIAYSLISDFDMDQIVDWGIELLEENIESKSIQILAGLTKPVNFFEGKKYLEKVLEELKLTEFSNEQKILSYCTYYINKIIEKKNIRDNLTNIYKICQRMNYEKNIYDFFLLYWAWSDLDYHNYNHYWESANRNNIETIVIDTAQKWIKEYSFFIKSSGQEKYFL